MPIREKLNHYLPSLEQFSRQKKFAFLGSALTDKHLWHLHRRSVALGVAIGIFCAYLPIPFESVIAVLLAIYLRANLATAFVMVFISNPLTWPILYTPAYKLGALLTHPDAFKFSHLLNPENYTFAKLFASKNNNLLHHYFTLWVGCLIIGPVAAVTGYFVTLWTWQLHIISRWKERKKVRKYKLSTKSSSKTTDKIHSSPALIQKSAPKSGKS